MPAAAMLTHFPSKAEFTFVRPWKGSSRKNKLPPKLWMEPHLRSNTKPREPIQENAFCSCYRDACPPPTRNSTVSLRYFHRGSLHGRWASCRLRQTSAPCFSRLPRAGRSSSRAPARSPTCPRYFDWQPGSPLSFPPTFGGGLPISASDRSPLAGVCAPQLLGHRGPQSAQDALAEVGRRRVGGETGSQRPREVGGAKPSTGCGRLASASHVGTAHAVGWEAEAPPKSAAALALAAPAARLGRGAGLLASVKPRVNVSGARGAGGGRSSGGVPASRGRSRDSPSTWPAAEGGRAAARSPSRGRFPRGCERTLLRLELVHPLPRSGRGRQALGALEPGARPAAWCPGWRSGGRPRGCTASTSREPEGRSVLPRPCAACTSSASLRRLCNAGRRASGEPELTVVGAGDLPTWDAALAAGCLRGL